MAHAEKVKHHLPCEVAFATNQVLAGDLVLAFASTLFAEKKTKTRDNGDVLVEEGVVGDIKRERCKK